MENGQEIKKLLGKNVKKQRNQMKLSLQKLADRVNVSRNVICGIEKGRNFVRADTLERLAQVFNMKPYELLKPDDVMPDKATDVLIKIGEEVREAVDKIGNRYLEDGKG